MIIHQLWKYSPAYALGSLDTKFSDLNKVGMSFASNFVHMPVHKIYKRFNANGHSDIHTFIFDTSHDIQHNLFKTFASKHESKGQKKCCNYDEITQVSSIEDLTSYEKFLKIKESAMMAAFMGHMLYPVPKSALKILTDTNLNDILPAYFKINQDIFISLLIQSISQCTLLSIFLDYTPLETHMEKEYLLHKKKQEITNILLLDKSLLKFGSK